MKLWMVIAAFALPVGYYACWKGWRAMQPNRRTEERK